MMSGPEGFRKLQLSIHSLLKSHGMEVIERGKLVNVLLPVSEMNTSKARRSDEK